MAVTKLTMSGFKPSTFNKYDDFLAGNAAYDPAATFLIATATGTGSSDTITFSSIPSTYKHLQIRILGKGTSTGSSGGANDAYLTINGDTGTNYTYHQLGGDGSSASAYGTTTQANIRIQRVIRSSATGYANMMGAAIIDIHNYASTTQYKTVRNVSGSDANNSFGEIFLSSGLWLNTSAVDSVTLKSTGTGNWTTSTKIALYGFTG